MPPNISVNSDMMANGVMHATLLSSLYASNRSTDRPDALIQIVISSKHSSVVYLFNLFNFIFLCA